MKCKRENTEQLKYLFKEGLTSHKDRIFANSSCVLGVGSTVRDFASEKKNTSEKRNSISFLAS